MHELGQARASDSLILLGDQHGLMRVDDNEGSWVIFGMRPSWGSAGGKEDRYMVKYGCTSACNLGGGLFEITFGGHFSGGLGCPRDGLGRG